ncbi:MAG: Ribonuclease P protein component, partial [uncultured Acetobacteraceae bacterium]
AGPPSPADPAQRIPPGCGTRPQGCAPRARAPSLAVRRAAAARLHGHQEDRRRRGAEPREAAPAGSGAADALRPRRARLGPSAGRARRHCDAPLRPVARRPARRAPASGRARRRRRRV